MRYHQLSCKWWNGSQVCELSQRCLGVILPIFLQPFPRRDSFSPRGNNPVNRRAGLFSSDQIRIVFSNAGLVLCSKQGNLSNDYFDFVASGFKSCFPVHSLSVFSKFGQGFQFSMNHPGSKGAIYLKWLGLLDFWSVGNIGLQDWYIWAFIKYKQQILSSPASPISVQLGHSPTTYSRLKAENGPIEGVPRVRFSSLWVRSRIQNPKPFDTKRHSQASRR